MKTGTEFSPLFQPLILGRGKLARHFIHYLNLKKIEHTHWADVRNLTPPFFQLLEKADSVWILVSDKAIAETYARLKKHDPSSTQVFIHASATLALPGMLTLHPLMTFGPEFYSLETYERFSFTCFQEEANDHQKFLTQFKEHFKNPILTLPNQDRVLYHAFCSMIANFPQILWSGVFAAAEGLQSFPSKPFPTEAFHPLLQQSSENFLKHGKKALTGPLVRQDHKTIEQHQKALRETSLESLYQNFVEFYETEK